MTAIQPVRKSGLCRLASAFLLFCGACENDSDADPSIAAEDAVAKSAAEGENAFRAQDVKAAEPLRADSSPAPSPLPPPWASRVSPGGGFPCEVDQVLAASCRRCHFEPRENDAPFSLVKYEDIEKLRSGKPISKLMIQMVEADLMPPLDEPLEPKVTPLTPAQKEILLDWLWRGAPRNPGKCP